LATVGELLLDVTNVLRAVERGYDVVWRSRERSDPTTAQFAAFLSVREYATIDAIEKYVERDEHHAALDVRVRLGAGFPFSADELAVPSDASVDDLSELARRTDELLATLSQRIGLYAASGELADLLTALDEIAVGRERELASALQELESLSPSPRQSHD
jgi:hypothetical protein